MSQVNFTAKDGRRMQIAVDLARGEDMLTAVLYERVGDAYKVVSVYHDDDARTAYHMAKVGKLMTDSKQPISYDSMGRMRYHPDFHARHKKPWNTTEQKYLIENYAIDGPEAVSLALERTIGVIMTRAYELRKAGLMPKFSRSTPRHKRVRPCK